MADKKQRLSLAGKTTAEIIDAVNKEYGENTMVLASKAKGLKIEFFSWGVDALDFATGGGIPKNRIISILGPYSALKTTIAYKSIASFQRQIKDGLAVLIDVEHSHDPKYCELLGVDDKRLGLVNPDSGEQAVDVLTDLTTVDQDLYAVVDSIAMLTPTSEIEASADQQVPGTQARLINKMMRTLVARMKRSLYDSKAATTTVLCVNQIREKIGIMFGSPETAPGGRGKDFAFSMGVTVRSGAGDRIMETRTINGIKREVRVAQKVRYSVTKNKVSGSQFDEGEFIYYVKPHDGNKAFTFNNLDVLLKFGLFYEVIQVKHVQKPGQKKPSEFHQYGEIEWSSPQSFRDQLKESVDDRQSLYIDILDAIRQENEGVERERVEEPEELPAKRPVKIIVKKR